ncbi:MAG: cell wall hydrolase [Lachnospiraceae bacterium]|nr:cell wall hydrolase [Lachnospiraceae bacterium]
MKQKRINWKRRRRVENVLQVLAIIILTPLALAATYISRNYDDFILAISQEVTNEAYEGPTNVEVHSMLVGPITVEPEEETTATLTGETSFIEVGMSEVVDKLPTNVTICTWENIALTQEEMELLYTTVYCESGDQGYEAQVLTALAILNRVASDKYSDELKGVIYQRNKYGAPQFSVIDWPDFELRGWTSSVEEACNYAMQHNDHPRDMYYFRAGKYHDFGVPYMKINDTYFSTEN